MNFKTSEKLSIRLRATLDNPFSFVPPILGTLERDYMIRTVAEVFNELIKEINLPEVLERQNYLSQYFVFGINNVSRGLTKKQIKAVIILRPHRAPQISQHIAMLSQIGRIPYVVLNGPQEGLKFCLRSSILDTVVAIRDLPKLNPTVEKLFSEISRLHQDAELPFITSTLTGEQRVKLNEVKIAAIQVPITTKKGITERISRARRRHQRRTRRKAKRSKIVLE